MYTYYICVLEGSIYQNSNRKLSIRNRPTFLYILVDFFPKTDNSMTVIMTGVSTRRVVDLFQHLDYRSMYILFFTYNNIIIYRARELLLGLDCARYKSTFFFRFAYLGPKEPTGSIKC